LSKNERSEIFKWDFFATNVYYTIPIQKFKALKVLEYMKKCYFSSNFLIHGFESPWISCTNASLILIWVFMITFAYCLLTMYFFSPCKFGPLNRGLSSKKQTNNDTGGKWYCSKEASIIYYLQHFTLKAIRVINMKFFLTYSSK